MIPGQDSWPRLGGSGGHHREEPLTATEQSSVAIDIAPRRWVLPLSLTLTVAWAMRLQRHFGHALGGRCHTFWGACSGTPGPSASAP